jgi:hypothetical protein
VLDESRSIDLGIDRAEISLEANNLLLTSMLDGGESLFKALELVFTEHANEWLSTIPVDLACLGDVV